MIRKYTTRNSLILILTAFIWGIAFVAQTEGGDAVGPFSFNCIRSIIGAVTLLPIIAFLDKTDSNRNKPVTVADKKLLLKGGIACGVVLCIASNLQQLGISAGSSTGKAGFLTACYIIIVPILGLLQGKKCRWNIWTGVAITVVGLYLLCIDGEFSIQLSDILLFLCAVFFAVHIIVIDRFSALVNGVRMSCIQFFVSGILTSIPMFIFEICPATKGFSAWAAPFLSLNTWIPILYAGVLSCGVAYTLQIIGQKNFNPTIASLLLSLESVFAVIAGWLILNQTMGLRQITGCVLIFTAVILAQINFADKNKA